MIPHPHKYFSFPLPREERAEKAIALASFLLKKTKQEETRKEQAREKEMARMFSDSKGKTFLTLLTDQAFRSEQASRTESQIRYLIKKFGLPNFLNEGKRIQFLLFLLLGKQFPHFFVSQIKKSIRKEMSPVLLPENPHLLSSFLKKRKKEGVRINLNHLGEAILGEEEASRRLNVYLSDLEDPQIEYISVKISTIYSQINQIGWKQSLEKLNERLKKLYRAAKQNRFKRACGKLVYKFVNLDMEEYKDLYLTVALFKKTLDEDEFHDLTAGIVLQSYIPESFAFQKELTLWAAERIKHGGAPIKIRVVKGANLAMEKVESSIKGWILPTYEKKIETDANFKRMIEFGCEQGRPKAVHLGIASHNLFDIAYGLTLKREKELGEEVEIEMLQGMAESMRRAVLKVAGGMVLYCPEAKEKDFHTAVAYLVRRLDENTGPENFLKDLYEIRLENRQWQDQKAKFLASFSLCEHLTEMPRRKQNRYNIQETIQEGEFQNEPDTDFSLPHHRKWALEILEEGKKKNYPPIPLAIGGSFLHAKEGQGIDPSRPHSSLYTYSLADLKQIHLAVETAKKEEKKWQHIPFSERNALLGKAAQLFRHKRKELIIAMIGDGGKTIAEADPEISEAIDFIEYYRRNWKEHQEFTDLEFTPKGTILVAPPWNFPCSIPAGSIAAALTAGNCVLFKPAPEAVLVGWLLVQCFWEAGIPKEVLQFINCEDETIGSALVKHPDVNAVLLTGGTLTALKFMQIKPGIDLNAETGGKNAIIVTSMSDRDLAIKDIVQSAFSHSGQKCSACSLAILEKEVYDDPRFLRTLKDATESLIIGSAWDPHTRVGPLIRPPEGALKRGLTQLEPGEEWLVEPKQCDGNPHLWSCGIKLGVTKGSFTHQTELFGPVLGLMRAENLEEAIELANATPYGLTSGLHSLDEREHQLWKEKICAGNLYINRTITGALVHRQPFGGCKASSFGFEAKAGGPNYLLSVANVSQQRLPKEKSSLPPSLVPLFSNLQAYGLSEEEQAILKKSCENYAYWGTILKKPKEVSQLLGQHNIYYCVPREKIVIRMTRNHRLALLQVLTACLICGTPFEISASEDISFLTGIKSFTWNKETEDTFLGKMKRGRIRLLGPVSRFLLEKAAEVGATLRSGPVLANGRIELLHYLREVSISQDYHRYGYCPDL